MIYLDNAATTRIDDRVLEAMMPYLKESYGNPSTPYEIGIKSAIAIENARKQFAKAFSCEPNQIYFTGGGSEGDNWVLKSFAFMHHDRNNSVIPHIITSKVEHDAVLNTCKFLEDYGFADITYIGVNKDCLVDVEAIEKAIDSRPTLISIMTANNEVGTIQPIFIIGDIASKYNNVWLHTDATQYIGHLQVDTNAINVDFITCSAHKFNGPKGVGVVYAKNPDNLIPFIHGGHQESSKRAGTENVAGIVGAGVAIQKSMEHTVSEYVKINNLVKYFIEQLHERNIKIIEHASGVNKIPGTVNIAFVGIIATSIQFMLDRYGICVGTGSACNSGSSNPSRVLIAMGINRDVALSSIRFSFSKNNTKEEVDYLVECIEKAIKEIKGDF